MPDAIRAAKPAMQRALRHAPLDPGARHPGVEQLLDADHTLLAGGDPRHLAVY